RNPCGRWVSCFNPTYVHFIFNSTHLLSTRKLIQRVREELTPDQKPQELLQLIETILVYKLPLLNRREIETMFSLDELKQTQYFQDVREEARQEGRLNKALEAVPRLLALGLSVEQVASALELEVKQVRAIQKET
ncbi:DUF2887 domain-containing protein, partial [Microcystis sp. M59BS1]|uniref:DUF2887 domain-containing protein n=3 Tax=unclassified Microcystis TaxID=2643300 RepID=UPI002584B573